MLTLRPYQSEAIADVRAAIASGTTRPAVVHATGLGKSVVIAHLVSQYLAEHSRIRALVLTHRDEIATQNRNKIHQNAPHLRPGIVMGNQRDHDRPVVVASVPTIGRVRDGRNSRRDQIHSVGLIIVDEAHHAAAPTWRGTLQHFGAFDGVPTIGFTATMARQDKRGLGEIWQDVVNTKDTHWGVRNGYLCDVRAFRVQVPALDLSGVHIRSGDLAQDETADAMLDANTGEAIVRSIQDPALLRCDGTDRGVVFCPNVETAIDFAAHMNDAGIRTGVILGTTPKEDRARIYRQFETGELEWLCNAMVLTEGWDAPWCNALIIARPTKAAALYQQMLGRGLRTFPGKTECIVLDVCGVTDVHGLASLTDLSMDRKVQPRNGQSLLEALDEFDALPEEEDNPWWPEPARPKVTKVIGTEIDIFGQSRSVWLKTNAGTWFVPAADQVVFLWPQPDGKFTLGRAPKLRPDPAVLLQGDLDLSIGMALAEQHAEQLAPDLVTGKDAPWRQAGRARPGQRKEMDRWGLEHKASTTAAQAYDRLNIAMASARLDG